MILSAGKILIIVGIVIVVLFLICLIWYISKMNQLRALEVKIEESLSGIDVALTKRYDLLTKMLQTTKGYAKHEAETLENVIKWRNGVPTNATIEERNEFASSLAKVASGLNVVMEQYPSLKADRMFSNLQASIADSEEQLQAARRFYNSNVSHLNSLIVQFPSSIVAKKINMTKKSFFEAEEAKRQDVNLEF